MRFDCINFSKFLNFFAQDSRGLFFCIYLTASPGPQWYSTAHMGRLSAALACVNPNCSWPSDIALRALQDNEDVLYTHDYRSGGGHPLSPPLPASSGGRFVKKKKVNGRLSFESPEFVPPLGVSSVDSGHRLAGLQPTFPKMQVCAVLWLCGVDVLAAPSRSAAISDGIGLALKQDKTEAFRPTVDTARGAGAFLFLSGGLIPATFLQFSPVFSAVIFPFIYTIIDISIHIYY